MTEKSHQENADRRAQCRAAHAQYGGLVKLALEMGFPQLAARIELAHRRNKLGTKTETSQRTPRSEA